MTKKKKYPEPKRLKVGRNLYVCDYDGKTPLIGLSWDSGNGQYYYSSYRTEKDYQTGKTSRKDYSFGVQYQDAVFEFKQWIRDNQKISLTVPTVEKEQVITKKLTPTIQQSLKDIYNDLGVDKEPPTEFIYRGSNIEPSNDIEILNEITTDKQYALHLIKQILQNEELRIETIRYLKLDDLLPKDYNILPIQSIFQFYKDENDCSAEEKGKVKASVEHFVSTVKKKNLNDITEEDIELFRDVIKSSKYSDSVKAGRLSKFKTCLNYYIENKKLNGGKELVRSVLAICKEKLKVSTPTPDEKPKSIDKGTIRKIFKWAKDDEELLLMFLLMLNTGFTPVDIRTLKKSMIRKMDKINYIVHRRTKTEGLYIRVNCLWDITIKLLKKQCDRFPNSDYVFITQVGGKYGEATLGKKFTTFFKAFNKKNKTSISAKHFKDTVASNLAFDVQNVNIIKVTLGHSIKGSKDEFWKYVEDRPEQLKPAIDILYKKFKNAIESIKSD